MAFNIKNFNFDAGDRMADLSLRAGSDNEVRSVDVYSIDEHPDNRSVSMEKVKSLKESIAQDGMGQYPLVRVSPDDEERYQHISGWHRILAYRALYEETQDEKYHRIPVVVLKGCDDNRALRLMWATNIFSTELTPAERGKGFEVLAIQVEEERAKDPVAFKGRRTNDILSEQLSQGDQKVSARTIARSRKAYREEQERSSNKDSKTDIETQESPKTVSEANKAIGMLSRAISYIEALQERGIEFDPQTLKHYQKRIKLCAQNANLNGINERDD